MLVDETTVAASIQKGPTELPPPPTQERIKQILQDLTLTVPQQEKQKYIDLILCNHDIFSVHKNDLGRANNFTHRIDLKNKAPVNIPQYRLADTTKLALDKQIDEWLKMGVIQPSNSRLTVLYLLCPKRMGKIGMC